MSMKFTPNFVELPTEILYCILDQINTQDILFSFRNVCTHFYAITNTYNRYKIHFTSTSSKSDIHRICRMIKPENVISFFLISTCTALDGIELFLSLIDISQFTRLKLLDLFNISHCDLHKILQHITTNFMHMPLSLKITFRDSNNDDTIELLLSAIAQSRIRKLFLENISDKIYQMLCSSQCTLETLVIQSCTHKQLCGILDHLPNLQSFSSNYYMMNTDDQIVLPTLCKQLTSLTLRSCTMLMDQLESLLSLTTSLVYLHIVSYFSTFDFLQHLSKWEHFICDKLPLLKHFKFYVHIKDYPYEKIKDIEHIINSFRTSFWIEQKLWYVACKYIKNSTRTDIALYSPSDSSIDFPDGLLPGILSCSTVTVTTKNDDLCNSRITWSVRLNVSKMIDAINSNQLSQPTHQIVNNITHLALDIDWPIDSFDLLSTLIDFSKLTEIWLFLSRHHYFDSFTMELLLNLARNVRTIGISYDDDSTQITEDMRLVLCRQIEQLKVKTMDFGSMKLTLESMKNMSSVTFVSHRGSTISWTDMIKWLNQTGRAFSQSNDCRSLQCHPIL
ncbi:unnamed protein product [Rotaria magnacalcarata]|uniref:F-box domain-containing protein n=1 Tax=Rotaria magnacalcarata TaxID=392030 RepID=A0A816YK58_9BILA|nr:unnamed protein product [Rotaria magnacalcarata]CAF2160501.1 unnamed protein product [Rotaria magnacalcarata]